MVSASRKKLVVVAAVLLAAAAVVAFATRPVRDAVRYAFLPAADKKVVGDWQTYSIGGVVVTSIHADHTWTGTGGCLQPPPTVRGHWRVDGADVVLAADPDQFGDLTAPAPTRVKIQQLIDDDRQVRSWASRAPNK
jgi:hypothetical protein